MAAQWSRGQPWISALPMYCFSTWNRTTEKCTATQLLMFNRNSKHMVSLSIETHSHRCLKAPKISVVFLLVPELGFQFVKAWPLAGVVWPTLCHQAVEGWGALRRHSQSLAVLYPTNDVVVLHTLERLDAIHQNLPHADTFNQTETHVVLDTEWRLSSDWALNLPNIHTSLAVVNRLKLIDSGAIHLIGNLPLDAGIRSKDTLHFTDHVRSIDKAELQKVVLVLLYLYSMNYLPCIVTNQSLPALHSRLWKPTHSSLQCPWGIQSTVGSILKRNSVLWEQIVSFWHFFSSHENAMLRSHRARFELASGTFLLLVSKQVCPKLCS